MESVLEHRIEAAGHRTRALEVAGNGPGIVLLHGWSDSADTWRPLLAQLGSRGRRAIAVDLPGFGEATRLHDGAVLPAAGRLRRRPRRALGGRRAGRGRRHVARRLPRAAAGRDPGRPAPRGRRHRSRPTASRCPPGSTRSRRTRSSASCCRSPSPSRACSCAARSPAPTASSPTCPPARRSARSSTRSAATARRARTSRRCSSPAAGSRPSSRPPRST